MSATLSVTATRPLPPAWTVLVAGGGLPALAFALALRRALGRAVAITVCDPLLDRPGRDDRAYALSPAVVRMIETLGLWPVIRSRAEPIRTMLITDGRLDDPVRPARLTFAHEDGRPLGHVVEAADLAPPLREACDAAGIVFASTGVDGFEVGEGAVVVRTADGQARSAALLVAADGARSRLREDAGIGWVGGPYGQVALVATVRHPRPHEGRAVQHFLPDGPFALLPLASRDGAHRSSIVWTQQERGRAQAIVAGGVAETAYELSRFGDVFGALELDGAVSARPLAVGLARRFWADRMALLGDCAHEIHPLAGQGLNLALADAAALAEWIVDSIRLGLDPGRDDVLRLYERDRRTDAVLMAATTDGLNRLFSNDNLVLRTIRDIGLALVDRRPGAKDFFIGEASGETSRAPRLLRGEPL